MAPHGVARVPGVNEPTVASLHAGYWQWATMNLQNWRHCRRQETNRS